MRTLRVLLSCLLALTLLTGCWAMAEESVPDDEPFLTGVVIDATMNSLVLRWTDGNDYIFSTAETDVDRSGLKNGLMVGATVVVTYSGEIDFEKHDAQNATVLAYSDGAFADASLLIKDGEEINFDLNGDGELETLSFVWAHSDDRDEDCAQFTAKTETAGVAFITDVISQPTALVCDLDPADGALDVLVSGDVMSDDFVTQRLSLKDGAFVQNGETIPGRAEGFQFGEVVIGDWVDMLGTRWCVTNFAMNAQGALAQAENTLWQVEHLDDEWSGAALETKAALPVTLIDGDNETASELPAGTKLQITASDNESAAYFLTEDGREGRIDVTASARGWGYDIAGAAEDDYFVSVPYAG